MSIGPVFECPDNLLERLPELCIKRRVRVEILQDVKATAQAQTYVLYCIFRGQGPDGIRTCTSQLDRLVCCHLHHGPTDQVRCCRVANKTARNLILSKRSVSEPTSTRAEARLRSGSLQIRK